MDFASVLRCIENTFLSTSTFLTSRDQNASSACGSGIINLAQTPIQPPAVAPASLLAYEPPKREHSDPDLVTLVKRLFPGHRATDEDDLPKLAVRSCLDGTVPGQARYHGQVVDICHNPLRADGQPILWRGESHSDNENLEDKPKRQK